MEGQKSDEEDPKSLGLRSAVPLVFISTDPSFEPCIPWTVYGRIVLEALILTSAVVSSLTGYTFWAAKKGKDFSYIGPFLFAGLTLLIVTSFVQVNWLSYATQMRFQVCLALRLRCEKCWHLRFLRSVWPRFRLFMFFPLGPASVAIYGGLGALLFAAYLVYDTDNLIRRFTYDEYIWASVALYLDILNLFLHLLQLLRSSDG
ncbi:hypothetical protein ACLOJK_025904 [Asimina triloba]